jgi:hypothetical protein
MEYLKKALHNKIFCSVLLFFFIWWIYYFFNVEDFHLYSKFFLGIAIGIVACLVYIFYFKDTEKKEEKLFKLIIIFGIILRIGYGLYNTFYSRQHDVCRIFRTTNNVYSLDNGHLGYIGALFFNKSLPTFEVSESFNLASLNQLYHPPLHHILQAIWMHINSLFIPRTSEVDSILQTLFNSNLETLKPTTLTKEQFDILNPYLERLLNTGRVLTMFYSCMTLLIIAHILKELKLPSFVTIMVLLYSASQPMLVFFSSFANNDSLSALFIFLTIYLSIRWYKKPSILLSIFLALSIALGILTKMGSASICLLVAIMFIAKLIEVFLKNKKEKNYKPLLNIGLYLGIFAIIALPLGLSYAIRNYQLYKQPLFYVMDLGPNNYLRTASYPWYDRFLLPNGQVLFQNIFHVFAPGDKFAVHDYNIWLDLVKTATYGEWGYSQVIVAAPMFILNLFFAVCITIIWIYIIFDIVKKLKKKEKIEYLIVYVICMAISLLYIITFAGSYIKYPFTCTSNYRYVTPLGIFLVLMASLYINQLNKPKIRLLSEILMYTYSMLGAIFILVI